MVVKWWSSCRVCTAHLSPLYMHTYPSSSSTSLLSYPFSHTHPPSYHIPTTATTSSLLTCAPTAACVSISWCIKIFPHLVINPLNFHLFSSAFFHRYNRRPLLTRLHTQKALTHCHRLYAFPFYIEFLIHTLYLRSPPASTDYVVYSLTCAYPSNLIVDFPYHPSPTNITAMSSTDVAEKPVRKFPPPCWTPDETLALIEAYRERWYALRRGYLRTADWEAVTASVTSRYPDASPPKTSAQCRHKMEKLRQRYRAEKQRSLSYPGRFFSSWFFFENMESLEKGTSPTDGSSQDAVGLGDSGNGSISNPHIDQNLVTVGFIPKNSWQIDENSDPKISFDRNLVTPFKPKNRGKVDEKSCPGFGSRVLNGYPPYLRNASDDDECVDFGKGFHVNSSVNGNSEPLGLKAKKFASPFGNSKPKFNENHDGEYEGARIFAKTRTEHGSVPSGFRQKMYDEVVYPNFDCSGGDYNGVDAEGGFWVKIPGGGNATVPSGLRGNGGGNTDRNSNEFSSSLRSGLGKMSGGVGGPKRDRDLVEEMVLSIHSLGKDFVKMEKMKMEMAKEIEKTRMEMEIKRNELILQSQRQIVEAFVKGLSEIKNKKVKTSVLSETT